MFETEKTENKARQMYILVNVANHQTVVGDIVRDLINTYNVPLNVVADIQQICPKCTTATINAVNSTPASPLTVPVTSSDERHAYNPSPPPPMRQKAASPRVMVTASPPKRQRLDEEEELRARTIKREPEAADEEEEALGTVLAAIQNGSANAAEMSSPSRRDSSDDVSNSSSHPTNDGDDYEFKIAPWTNPDFLNQFIASQPLIFGMNTVGDVKHRVSSMSPTSSAFNTPSTATPAAAPPQRSLPMLTVNGKTRRGRIVYTTNELNILEQYYEADPNACADPVKRDILCRELNVDYHRLKVWFQNRRRKDKVRSLEETIISNL